jgi:hypothetical protein
MGKQLASSCRLLMISLLLLVLFGCSQTNNNYRRHLMDTNNQSFFDISLNSEERTPCSPAEKPSDWLGVVINAPLSIDKTKSIFPVCGFYRLSLFNMPDSEPLKIWVRHVESGIEYTGFMIDIDDNLEAPMPFIEAPDKDASEYESMILAAYFNPNILDYVEMPLIAGSYQVVIEYGHEKSNMVRVSIDN